MRALHHSIRGLLLLILAATPGSTLFVVATTTVTLAASDCSCRTVGDGRCVRNPECRRRYYHSRRAGPVAGSPYRSGPYVGRAVDDAAPPTRAPASLPSPAPSGPARSAVVAGARPRVLDSGYGHLFAPGKEQAGYGLYSYVIVPDNTPRGAALLTEIFRQVRSIESRPAKPIQLNIIYLPMQGDRKLQFDVVAQTLRDNPDKLGAEYLASYYDYTTAQSLLYHVCNPPHDRMQDICQGAPSRGPYIFTYAAPASQIEPVPPPFLFIDLSSAHVGAFGELVAAFRAQVMRPDISDRAKIDTLRLKLLTLTLLAADMVDPVEKAMAKIVRTGSDDKR